MKKITALVLALVLALALLPVSAFAADVPQGPFDDISGERNQNSILWCYDQGLLSGTGNGHFSPDKEVTRAMAAAVLFRGTGSTDGPSFPFEDVPAGSWYAKPVQWAYSRGYISGTSPRTFSPNQAITRQDLALMLRRQACCGGETSAEDFSPTDYDSIAPYAREAVCWAYREGILSMDGNGRLNPRAKVTRAELASILKRVYDEPKQAFNIDPANITKLSIRSNDGRYESSVPAERVEKIVEYLNSFAYIEKEVFPGDLMAPGGSPYYMDFTSSDPDVNNLRVSLHSNGSLGVFFFDSDSTNVTHFTGKQPATALKEYLDDYFQDIPFADFNVVVLVDLDASEIDDITMFGKNSVPYVKITAPTEIEAIVNALNAIEAYTPAVSQELPQVWEYEIKVGENTLHLCEGDLNLIALTVDGETVVYQAALGTDLPMWELAENYFKDLPDKGTPPEES